MEDILKRKGMPMENDSQSPVMASLDEWRTSRGLNPRVQEIQRETAYCSRQLKDIAKEMEFLQTPWVSLAYDLLDKALPIPKGQMLESTYAAPRAALAKISDHLELVGFPPEANDIFHEMDADVRLKDEHDLFVMRLLDSAAATISNSVYGEVPRGEPVVTARRNLLTGPRGSAVGGLPVDNYEERMEKLTDFARQQVERARLGVESAHKEGLEDRALELQERIEQVEGLMATNTRPAINISDAMLGKARQHRKLARLVQGRIQLLEDTKEHLTNVQGAIDRLAPMDDPEIAGHLTGEVVFRTFNDENWFYVDEGALSSPIVSQMFPSIRERSIKPGDKSVSILDGTTRGLSWVRPQGGDVEMSQAHILAAALEQFQKSTTASEPHPSGGMGQNHIYRPHPQDSRKPFDPKRFWGTIVRENANKRALQSSLWEGVDLPENASQARELSKTLIEKAQVRIDQELQDFKTETGQDLDSFLSAQGAAPSENSISKKMGSAPEKESPLEKIRKLHGRLFNRARGDSGPKAGQPKL